MSSILQDPVYQLDRSRYAAPQVAEDLRELIILTELPPGTVLARQELAARYGISQTPVRDALMRLSEEGLVDIFPQHATVVSKIDMSRVRQAHFLRRSVELEIVFTLADRPDELLVERLRNNLARQRAMLDIGDMTEFTVTDQVFHRLMYEAASVPDLWNLVRRLSADLDRLRRLHLPISGKANAILDDHIAIVDAISKGDPLAAQVYLRKHLSGTLSNVDEIRKRFPMYIKG